MTRTHVPVLAGELIELTAPTPGENAVDCTFGAGGHARLVAGRIGPGGTLVCVDRDPAAEERFEELAAEVACETRFLGMDYAEALALLGEEGFEADLVYLDLGVSSMQVDARERGFSYSYDAPLDMRMDPSQPLSAADVVNEWDRRRLARALREYGEERYADRIAAEVIRRRPMSTTSELVDAITAAIPTPARFAGGHPAKRSFQAIRIEVNEELDVLPRALDQAIEVLQPRGRCVVLAYHSGEDRIVKDRFARAASGGCTCPPGLPCVCGAVPHVRLVWRGTHRPGPDELAANPRSESARLRAAEKLETPA